MQRTLREAPKRRAFWREFPYAIDSEAAFIALFASSPTAFWLDSSSIDRGRSRWSYLGDVSGPNAALVKYHCLEKRLDISDQFGPRVEHGAVFEYLDRNPPTLPQCPPPCPFVGGHVGWFGYELRHDCDFPTHRRAGTPDALFIRADRFIAIDHAERRSYVVAIDDPDEESRSERWILETIARIGDLRPARTPDGVSRVDEPLVFLFDRDKATYLDDIERSLEWIRQGETYQVCLTNEISCSVYIDPLALYRVLRRVNPAPYAAFLKWPGGSVLSASPERFLTVDRTGRVETKPIKGTIARSSDPVLDKMLAERLWRSEKDRAENVMIVDLLRNDLSKVCEPGSVVVPKLFAIENYATVHQLVSTVQGILKERCSTTDLIRAAFPGGSMTGAPKKRTLELIDTLERRARGVYSGALGWLGDDGTCDLSIVIRTIVATKGRLSLGVGGGIVAQSVPESEFSEMLLKAKASINAIVTACKGTFGPQHYRLVGAARIDFPCTSG